MGYTLAIDVGTTFTAAAVGHGTRTGIVRLGDRDAAVPTLVHLGEDGATLVGEAAERRALDEPERVAREFKRRLGDPTPMFLGGVPVGVEVLMGAMLGWVAAVVADREGTAPDGVVLTVPATWGSYRIELVHQAAAHAGIDAATIVAEPVAAATHYATHAGLVDGGHLAVYDLGGGTFDAAVIRREGAHLVLAGEPVGIEHLGGGDLDMVVWEFVHRALDDPFAGLDPADPVVLAAAALLARECRSAKEALSHDTATAIPVMVPGRHTTVRLTRAEFERLIRPAIGETVTTLERALRAADVGPQDLAAVLLVGGSSRIPLVAELLAETLQRPVSIDADPKHTTALGAVAFARPYGQSPIADPPVPPRPRPRPQRDATPSVLTTSRHDDAPAPAATFPAVALVPSVEPFRRRLSPLDAEHVDVEAVEGAGLPTGHLLAIGAGVVAVLVILIIVLAVTT
jgi:molecular chaperone DnaK (HSP70)